MTPEAPEQPVATNRNAASVIGRLALLGPGMLFAASAVGVSHLVQSTRAGAAYGLTLAGLIVAVCLLKYPAFRFSSDYAVITGKSLLYGYQRQGRLVLLLFALILPIDMFIATAAVSLVAAGLTMNLLGLSMNIVSTSLIVLLVCMTVLVIGKYRLLEDLIKLFVLLFSLITVLATLLIIPELVAVDTDLFPAPQWERTTILFVIAVAGWMPTSITASVFQSLWVCARQDSGRQKLDLSSARFDFNTGYIATILLALCFVLLGSALLYSSGVSLSASAAGFAGQLIDMFSGAVGNWLYPVVSLSALAVMYSTVLTLLDAGPRAANDVLNRLGALFSGAPDTRAGKDWYTPLVILQVAVSASILLVFLTSFTAFIDFATSVAFLTAPILAFLNQRAICSDDIPAGRQPGLPMKIWSTVGILIMATIAICYLYYRFSA